MSKFIIRIIEKFSVPVQKSCDAFVRFVNNSESGKIYRERLDSIFKANELGLRRIWSKFNRIVVHVFALADHSSLRHPRIFLRVVAAGMVIFTLWAVVFHIDQVVHARGQVIATNRTQIVQAMDNGILAVVKVHDGDEVEAGQVVALMDGDRAHAAYGEAYSKVVALRMTLARLQAEVTGSQLEFDQSLKDAYPDLVKTQMDLYTQRRIAINAQLRVLEDNVRLATMELQMNAPLEKMGDISKADILKLKRTVNEASGTLAGQKNKYLQDSMAELNKAQEDLNTQQEILADRQQIMDQTKVVSPVKGVVKNLKLTTIGAVVRQGEEIMQILPTESRLIVEAKVKPEDMGHMKVGLQAKVKLDSYDYTVFGSLNGEVSYISADASNEDTKTGPLTYYIVKIDVPEFGTTGQHKHLLDAKPGMTVTADIKTGDRSVFAILSKPLTKTFMEAFGER